MKKKKRDPKKWARKWLKSGWKIKSIDTQVDEEVYRKNYDAIDWGKDKECQCASPEIVENVGAIAGRGYLRCKCGGTIKYDIDYWKKHNIKQPIQTKKEQK